MVITSRIIDLTVVKSHIQRTVIFSQKSLASIVCAGVVLLVSVAAGAETRDWLNNNSVNYGSTIKELLQTLDRMAQDDPELKIELSEARNSFAIIFVPGILGSSLESATKGKLWGFGMPEADKLRLAPELVDETRQSDVSVALAEEVAGISLYRDAISKIRASAAKIGIPAERVVACGYDWRRDIRWGAKELNDCITGRAVLQAARSLIIIAHSMGGVVAWQWHQQYTPDGLVHEKRIVAIAVLGSPLAGSCEMLRMIETGYVQPAVNDKLRNDEWIKRFWSKISQMKDRFVNAVTGAFSQELRPVILTWPGAIDLTPRPGDTIDNAVCLRVPLVADDPTDRRALSYYDPNFWSAPIGEDLLHGFQLDWDVKPVLAKAADFRSRFVASTLATPTYLFASHVWRTPDLAGLTGDFRLSSEDWHTEEGDGRVPFLSAMPPTVKPADATRVYSVHGNLPEDEVFHSDFFGDRLPRIMSAYIATEMLKHLNADPVRQRAFVAKGGTLVNPQDFYVAFERQNQRGMIYPLTKEAWQTAEDFNAKLCDIPGKCDNYKNAKIVAAKAKTEAGKSAAFSAVTVISEPGSREETFARAQRGLAMARSFNWAAAIADLRDAVPALEAIQRSYGTKEPANIRDLRVNSTAMLGRSLVIRGFCEEARPLLAKAAKEKNKYAISDRQSPCYDRDTGKVVKPN